MKLIFSVQELYPLTFQKMATDRHLFFLQSPIYSVRTIQYSRILSRFVGISNSNGCWMTAFCHKKIWLNETCFSVREVWLVLAKKTATDCKLLLLHLPIYSVCTIQFSQIFVKNLATFQKQRTLDDSIFRQNEHNEWSTFFLCRNFIYWPFKKWQQIHTFFCFIVQYTEFAQFNIRDFLSRFEQLSNSNGH